MKKRLLAVLLISVMTLSMLTACHDSSEKTATKDVKATGYDPEKAAADFDFGELSDEEKNYTIEMDTITVITW